MKHQLLVPLNRQQLELIDRTILEGVAADRAALLRLALHEYAPLHAATAAEKQPVSATSKAAS